MSPAPPIAIRVAAALAALAAGLVAGCLATPEEVAFDSARRPIVGGADEAGFPYAGQIVVEGFLGEGMVCSAVAVTPTVLLTAAHCLVPGTIPLVSNYTEASTLRFQTWNLGEGEGTGSRVDLDSRRLCPSWDRAHALTYGDVGVVRLEEPLEIATFPLLRDEPVTSADVGTRLLAVGFGQTDGGGPPGLKRSVPMVLTANAGGYLSIRHPMPESWRGVCFGDSGGGSFVPGPSRDLLYGVHSAALDGACGTGADTSVARYHEAFLREAILDLDPEAERCGDGICTGLERAETCPDDCAPPGCGDGVVDSGEVCDDGGNVDGDGCSADCSSDERCGNGVVDVAAGETCDDGGGPPTEGCSSECGYAPVCGNGILDVDAAEGCDDGNALDGDGCSAACLLETCGDGRLDDDLGEECDDGNLVPGDGCSETCLDERGRPVADCACRAASPRPSTWAAALLGLF